MNIDEVESGKGLRLYFRGIREYAKRQAQILSQKGATRWHYQQRRVRARREETQGRIDQLRRDYKEYRLNHCIKEGTRVSTATK